MIRRHAPLFRAAALFIAVSFLGQDVLWAYPELPAERLSLAKPDAHFDLPYSVAFVEDSYQAPSAAKTIILIQDAHTNESAQLHIADALDRILAAEKIKSVFMEGATGESSLSFLRETASPAARKEAAGSFLRKGLLQGSEYLDLTSDRDFELWGVEDQALYEKSLEAYRAVVSGRAQFTAYAARIQSLLEALKPMVFNPALVNFDEKRAAHDKDLLPLTDYAAELKRQAVLLGMNPAAWPHLEALDRVKQLEARIDFEKAGAEAAAVLEKLPASSQAELRKAAQDGLMPAKAGFKAADGQRAYFAALQDQAGPLLRGARELRKYFAYLKAAGSIDAKAILAEKSILEDAVAGALAKTADERSLLAIQSNLAILKKLADLNAVPDETSRYAAGAAEFDLVYLTGFLNKKIMDLGLFYEKALTLESEFSDFLRNANDFYSLTRQRDQAFIDNALQKMDKDGGRKAVLIAGGYHMPGLKALLKQRGISYVCVMPQVLHPTDTTRYERILLAQGSRPVPSQIASAPLQPRDDASGISIRGIRTQAGIDFGSRPFAQITLVRLAERLGSRATARVRAVLGKRKIEPERGIAGARAEIPLFQSDYFTPQTKSQPSQKIRIEAKILPGKTFAIYPGKLEPRIIDAAVPGAAHLLEVELTQGANRIGFIYANVEWSPLKGITELWDVDFLLLPYWQHQDIMTEAWRLLGQFLPYGAEIEIPIRDTDTVFKLDLAFAFARYFEEQGLAVSDDWMPGIRRDIGAASTSPYSEREIDRLYNRVISILKSGIVSVPPDFIAANSYGELLKMASFDESSFEAAVRIHRAPERDGFRGAAEVVIRAVKNVQQGIEPPKATATHELRGFRLISDVLAGRGVSWVHTLRLRAEFHKKFGEFIAWAKIPKAGLTRNPLVLFSVGKYQAKTTPLMRLRILRIQDGALEPVRIDGEEEILLGLVGQYEYDLYELTHLPEEGGARPRRLVVIDSNRRLSIVDITDPDHARRIPIGTDRTPYFNVSQTASFPYCRVREIGNQVFVTVETPGPDGSLAGGGHIHFDLATGEEISNPAGSRTSQEISKLKQAIEREAEKLAELVRSYNREDASNNLNLKSAKLDEAAKLLSEKTPASIGKGTNIIAAMDSVIRRWNRVRKKARILYPRLSNLQEKTGILQAMVQRAEDLEAGQGASARNIPSQDAQIVQGRLDLGMNDGPYGSRLSDAYPPLVSRGAEREFQFIGPNREVFGSIKADPGALAQLRVDFFGRNADGVWSVRGEVVETKTNELRFKALLPQTDSYSYSVSWDGGNTFEASSHWIDVKDVLNSPLTLDDFRALLSSDPGIKVGAMIVKERLAYFHLDAEQSGFSIAFRSEVKPQGITLVVYRYAQPGTQGPAIGEPLRFDLTGGELDDLIKRAAANAERTLGRSLNPRGARVRFSQNVVRHMPEIMGGTFLGGLVKMAIPSMGTIPLFLTAALSAFLLGSLRPWIDKWRGLEPIESFVAGKLEDRQFFIFNPSQKALDAFSTALFAAEENPIVVDTGSYGDTIRQIRMSGGKIPNVRAAAAVSLSDLGAQASLRRLMLRHERNRITVLLHVTQESAVMDIARLRNDILYPFYKGLKQHRFQRADYDTGKIIIVNTNPQVPMSELHDEIARSMPHVGGKEFLQWAKTHVYLSEGPDFQFDIQDDFRGRVKAALPGYIGDKALLEKTLSQIQTQQAFQGLNAAGIVSLLQEWDLGDLKGLIKKRLSDTVTLQSPEIQAALQAILEKVGKPEDFEADLFAAMSVIDTFIQMLHFADSQVADRMRAGVTPKKAEEMTTLRKSIWYAEKNAAEAWGIASFGVGLRRLSARPQGSRIAGLRALFLAASAFLSGAGFFFAPSSSGRTQGQEEKQQDGDLQKVMSAITAQKAKIDDLHSRIVRLQPGRTGWIYLEKAKPSPAGDPSIPRVPEGWMGIKEEFNSSMSISEGFKRTGPGNLFERNFFGQIQRFAMTPEGLRRYAEFLARMDLDKQYKAAHPKDPIPQWNMGVRDALREARLKSPESQKTPEPKTIKGNDKLIHYQDLALVGAYEIPRSRLTGPYKLTSWEIVQIEELRLRGKNAEADAILPDKNWVQPVSKDVMAEVRLLLKMADDEEAKIAPLTEEQAKAALNLRRMEIELFRLRDPKAAQMIEAAVAKLPFNAQKQFLKVYRDYELADQKAQAAFMGSNEPGIQLRKDGVKALYLEPIAGDGYGYRASPIKSWDDPRIPRMAGKGPRTFDAAKLLKSGQTVPLFDAKGKINGHIVPVGIYQRPDPKDARTMPRPLYYEWDPLTYEVKALIYEEAAPEIRSKLTHSNQYRTRLPNGNYISPIVMGVEFVGNSWDISRVYRSWADMPTDIHPYYEIRPEDYQHIQKLSPVAKRNLFIALNYRGDQMFLRDKRPYDFQKLIGWQPDNIWTPDGPTVYRNDRGERFIETRAQERGLMNSETRNDVDLGLSIRRYERMEDYPSQTEFMMRIAANGGVLAPPGSFQSEADDQLYQPYEYPGGYLGSDWVKMTEADGQQIRRHLGRLIVLGVDRPKLVDDIDRELDVMNKHNRVPTGPVMKVLSGLMEQIEQSDDKEERYRLIQRYADIVRMNPARTNLYGAIPTRQRAFVNFSALILQDLDAELNAQTLEQMRFAALLMMPKSKGSRTVRLQKRDAIRRIVEAYENLPERHPVPQVSLDAAVSAFKGKSEGDEQISALTLIRALNDLKGWATDYLEVLRERRQSLRRPRRGNPIVDKKLQELRDAQDRVETFVSRILEAQDSASSKILSLYTAPIIQKIEAFAENGYTAEEITSLRKELNDLLEKSRRGFFVEDLGAMLDIQLRRWLQDQIKHVDAEIIRKPARKLDFGELMSSMGSSMGDAIQHSIRRAATVKLSTVGVILAFGAGIVIAGIFVWPIFMAHWFPQAGGDNGIGADQPGVDPDVIRAQEEEKQNKEMTAQLAQKEKEDAQKKLNDEKAAREAAQRAKIVDLTNQLERLPGDTATSLEKSKKIQAALREENDQLAKMNAVLAPFDGSFGVITDANGKQTPLTSEILEKASGYAERWPYQLLDINGNGYSGQWPYQLTRLEDVHASEKSLIPDAWKTSLKTMLLRTQAKTKSGPGPISYQRVELTSEGYKELHRIMDQWYVRPFNYPEVRAKANQLDRFQMDVQKRIDNTDVKTASGKEYAVSLKGMGIVVSKDGETYEDLSKWALRTRKLVFTEGKDECLLDGRRVILGLKGIEFFRNRLELDYMIRHPEAYPKTAQLGREMLQAQIADTKEYDTQKPMRDALKASAGVYIPSSERKLGQIRTTHQTWDSYFKYRYDGAGSGNSQPPAIRLAGPDFKLGYKGWMESLDKTAQTELKNNPAHNRERVRIMEQLLVDAEESKNRPIIVGGQSLADRRKSREEANSQKRDLEIQAEREAARLADAEKARRDFLMQAARMGASLQQIENAETLEQARTLNLLAHAQSAADPSRKPQSPALDRVRQIEAADVTLRITAQKEKLNDIEARILMHESAMVGVTRIAQKIQPDPVNLPDHIIPEGWTGLFWDSIDDFLKARTGEAESLQRIGRTSLFNRIGHSGKTLQYQLTPTGLRFYALHLLLKDETATMNPTDNMDLSIRQFLEPFKTGNKIFNALQEGRMDEARRLNAQRRRQIREMKDIEMLLQRGKNAEAKDRMPEGRPWDPPVSPAVLSEARGLFKMADEMEARLPLIREERTKAYHELRKMEGELFRLQHPEASARIDAAAAKMPHDQQKMFLERYQDFQTAEGRMQASLMTANEKGLKLPAQKAVAYYSALERGPKGDFRFSEPVPILSWDDPRIPEVTDSTEYLKQNPHASIYPAERMNTRQVLQSGKMVSVYKDGQIIGNIEPAGIFGHTPLSTTTADFSHRRTPAKELLQPRYYEWDPLTYRVTKFLYDDIPPELDRQLTRANKYRVRLPNGKMLSPIIAGVELTPDTQETVRIYRSAWDMFTQYGENYEITKEDYDRVKNLSPIERQNWENYLGNSWTTNVFERNGRYYAWQEIFGTQSNAILDPDVPFKNEARFYLNARSQLRGVFDYHTGNEIDFGFNESGYSGSSYYNDVENRMIASIYGGVIAPKGSFGFGDTYTPQRDPHVYVGGEVMKQTEADRNFVRREMGKLLRLAAYKQTVEAVDQELQIMAKQNRVPTRPVMKELAKLMEKIEETDNTDERDRLIQRYAGFVRINPARYIIYGALQTRQRAFDFFANVFLQDPAAEINQENLELMKYAAELLMPKGSRARMSSIIDGNPLRVAAKGIVVAIFGAIGALWIQEDKRSAQRRALQGLSAAAGEIIWRISHFEPSETQALARIMQEPDLTHFISEITQAHRIIQSAPLVKLVEEAQSWWLGADRRIVVREQLEEVMDAVGALDLLLNLETAFSYPSLEPLREIAALILQEYLVALIRFNEAFCEDLHKLGFKEELPDYAQKLKSAKARVFSREFSRSRQSPARIAGSRAAAVSDLRKDITRDRISAGFTPKSGQDPAGWLLTALQQHLEAQPSSDAFLVRVSDLRLRLEQTGYIRNRQPEAHIEGKTLVIRLTDVSSEAAVIEGFASAFIQKAIQSALVNHNYNAHPSQIKAYRAQAGQGAPIAAIPSQKDPQDAIIQWHTATLMPALRSILTDGWRQTGGFFDGLARAAAGLPAEEAGAWTNLISRIRQTVNQEIAEHVLENNREAYFRTVSLINTGWTSKRGFIFLSDAEPSDRNRIALFRQVRPAITVVLKNGAVPIYFAESLDGRPSSSALHTGLELIAISPKQIEDVAKLMSADIYLYSRYRLDARLLREALTEAMVREELGHASDDLEVRNKTKRKFISNAHPDFLIAFHQVHLLPQEKTGGVLSLVWTNLTGGVMDLFADRENTAGLVRAAVIELSGQLRAGATADPALLIDRWKAANRATKRTLTVSVEYLADVIGTELLAKQLGITKQEITPQYLLQAMKEGRDYSDIYRQIELIEQIQGRKAIQDALASVARREYSSPMNEPPFDRPQILGSRSDLPASGARLTDFYPPLRKEDGHDIQLVGAKREIFVTHDFDHLPKAAALRLHLYTETPESSSWSSFGEVLKIDSHPDGRASVRFLVRLPPNVTDYRYRISTNFGASWTSSSHAVYVKDMISEPLSLADLKFLLSSDPGVDLREEQFGPWSTQFQLIAAQQDYSLTVAMMAAEPWPGRRVTVQKYQSARNGGTLAGAPASMDLSQADYGDLLYLAAQNMADRSHRTLEDTATSPEDRLKALQRLTVARKMMKTRAVEPNHFISAEKYTPWVRLTLEKAGAKLAEIRKIEGEIHHAAVARTGYKMLHSPAEVDAISAALKSFLETGTTLEGAKALIHQLEAHRKAWLDEMHGNFEKQAGDYMARLKGAAVKDPTRHGMGVSAEKAYKMMAERDPAALDIRRTRALLEKHQKTLRDLDSKFHDHITNLALFVQLGLDLEEPPVVEGLETQLPPFLQALDAEAPASSESIKKAVEYFVKERLNRILREQGVLGVANQYMSADFRHALVEELTRRLYSLAIPAVFVPDLMDRRLANASKADFAGFWGDVHFTQQHRHVNHNAELFYQRQIQAILELRLVSLGGNLANSIEDLDVYLNLVVSAKDGRQQFEALAQYFRILWRLYSRGQISYDGVHHQIKLLQTAVSGSQHIRRKTKFVLEAILADISDYIRNHRRHYVRKQSIVVDRSWIETFSFLHALNWFRRERRTAEWFTHYAQDAIDAEIQNAPHQEPTIFRSPVTAAGQRGFVEDPSLAERLVKTGSRTVPQKEPQVTAADVRTRFLNPVLTAWGQGVLGKQGIQLALAWTPADHVIATLEPSKQDTAEVRFQTRSSGAVRFADFSGQPIIGLKGGDGWARQLEKARKTERSARGAKEESYRSEKLNRSFERKNVPIEPPRPYVAMINLSIFEKLAPQDAYFVNYMKAILQRNLSQGDVYLYGLSSEHELYQKAQEIAGSVRKKKGSLLEADPRLRGDDTSIFVYLHKSGEGVEESENSLHFFVDEIPAALEERNFIPMDAVTDLMVLAGVSVRPERKEDGEVVIASVPQALIGIWNRLRGLSSEKPVTEADIKDSLRGKKGRIIRFGPMKIDLTQLGRMWQIMAETDIFA